MFLRKKGLQGTYLNTIKAAYSKPVVNITLNVEKFKTITLKSEKRQGCPLLQDVLESLKF